MTNAYTPTHTLEGINPDAEGRRLAMAMYERIIAELEALPDEAWDAPTVCDPWTVADIVRHLVGAAKGHASLREMARQSIYGRRHRAAHGGNDLDAMNDLQVADHALLGPDELLTELRAIAPRAVDKRMSRPGLLRRMRLPMSPGGSTAPGMPDSLTMGRLLTVILTRDVLLHRLDIARAAGSTLTVDDVEARLVEDVVAEWSDRHGKAFRLNLTGPAGGHFESGSEGPLIELDALEFCWILSGRGDAPHPLLETRVVF